MLTASVQAKSASGCCDKDKSKATTAKSDKPCCGKNKGATTVSAESSGCKGKAKAALASLPSITYQVGDFTTCCQKTAAAKAEELHATLSYVVENKVYSNYDEAVVTLTKLLQEKADEMRSVQYVAGKDCVRCPKQAAALAKEAGTEVKYRLAGFDFDCKDKAEKVAKEVEAAVEGMHVDYMADGQPVNCDKGAKAEGKTVTYVVGDQQTDCELTAKMMLAEQIVRTIVEQVAEAAATPPTGA